MPLGQSRRVREKMPWLIGVVRRTNEDIKERLRIQQIYHMITSKIARATCGIEDSSRCSFNKSFI